MIAIQKPAGAGFQFYDYKENEGIILPWFWLGQKPRWSCLGPLLTKTSSTQRREYVEIIEFTSTTPITGKYKTNSFCSHRRRSLPIVQTHDSALPKKESYSRGKDS
jgi:hypothetical protein